MKRRALIAAAWAAVLALILVKGWTTVMWIYIGVTVFLLFAGSLSRDEKEQGQKKHRSFRGIYANESGGKDGSGAGHSETMATGGRGIMLSPRYTRDRLYGDAEDNAQAAEDRRTRAD